MALNTLAITNNMLKPKPNIPFVNNYGVKHFPRHVAIIPDGNRRWAKKNNIPTLKAHEMAVDRLVPFIEDVVKATDVEVITLWGLSSENLSRPPGEVTAIYDVVLKFVPKFLPLCHEHGIRVRRIGSVVGIPEEVLEVLDDATQETSHYDLRQVNIALNYGGRTDIVEAINQLMSSNPSQGELSVKDIDNYVSMGNDKFPEPELIVRTGNDSTCFRSSGFLTWQGMNSTYYFIKDFLPDVTMDLMFQAFKEYENFLISNKLIN